MIPARFAGVLLALALILPETRCLQMPSPVGELRSIKVAQNCPILWGHRMRRKESKTWMDY
ncbi:von Willebrand factor [Homo sapiens]|uniref:von Willebrand factor n=1 Tax=Homo sapiens TaxID=9606 RepID=I3L4K4_HUMAN|nr:von Willebrand factor [Homo sapiens]KAI2563898.1 von Willebrand factor [Homo sapiens]KAI4064161.1 von Willebrand factor [Homo sapiens]KAI4064162.1 von Willebrand factor [Homo sapiens]